MNLDEELTITRTLFSGDVFFNSPTTKQLQKLIITLKDAGIKDRDLRLQMLREWTGLNRINSSKHLTLHIISVMIDHLCGDTGGITFDGIRFLTLLSFKAKAHLTTTKSEAHIDGDEDDLSDLQ